MSLGLLIPGQGTQHAGMLPWLHASDCPSLTSLQEALGLDWRARLNDQAWSTQNHHAQVLITGVALALWELLGPCLPSPRVMAGYSVGEIAACSIAGVYDAFTAMQLAHTRARLMDDAAHAQMPTGLLVMHGISDTAWLEQKLRQWHLHVAIQLAPDRLIVGGALSDLDQCASAGAAQGITCTRLAVRLASHTPSMRAAIAPWQEALSHVAFSRPQAALVTNAEASVSRRPEALRHALVHQVSHTVRWDLCMEAMAECQPHCLLELGPGNTLSRLWRERYPDIPARSADEFQHPDAIVEWVHKQLQHAR
jgi:[acyl-carrier-protein] S-malonyltransferase